MVSGGTRNSQSADEQSTYISGEAFADLEQALEDALDFERGERRDLSVIRIQCPTRLQSVTQDCDPPKS
jgi:hypothetical protein